MLENTNTINRFWSKVNKTDSCWNWTAAQDRCGYGVYSVRENNKITALKTHRLSYSLTNGPIPKDMFVCHHCDNPVCVRPDHLFLGTHSDNMKDKINKNRHRHMFSDEEVLFLRTASTIDIQQRFNLTPEKARHARFRANRFYKNI